MIATQLLRIGDEFVEHRLELEVRRRVERIHHLGAVQRDDGEVAFALDLAEFRHRRSFAFEGPTIVAPSQEGEDYSMADARDARRRSRRRSRSACASAPPVEPRAECPAPGPRAAPESAVDAAGDAQRGADSCSRVAARAATRRAPEQRAPDAPASAPRLDCAGWLAATSDAYLYDAINRGPGA